MWKTDDGQPMSKHFDRVMTVHLKRWTGVNSGGGPHRFRYYFAPRFLENGGDLNILRLLLSHSTLDRLYNRQNHWGGGSVIDISVDQGSIFVVAGGSGNQSSGS